MLKKFLPKKVILWLKQLFYNKFVNKVESCIYKPYAQWINKRYTRIVDDKRKKKQLTVAFFVFHESVWKYDDLYKLMSNDCRFNPVIVICPYVIYGRDKMQHDMNNAYEKKKKKGYQVIKALDEKSRRWLNLKKVIKPDIIFFTNPHKLTMKKYYITNYLDCLTCYVPYNFGNSHLFQEMHNQKFHNLLWRFFAETEIHKGYSVDYADNKGVNAVVTGYPGTDRLIDKNYIASDIWKSQAKKKIRIIWAPHHTIDENKNFLS